MEKNCGNCKHWGEPGRIYRQPFKWCVRIKHDERRECDDGPKVYDNDDVSVFDEPAVAIDGSGYSAGVMTRAEFSCSLHEPAEQTP